MQLLVCLADRAGAVLSVENLLDLVWKDVVVSTDSVYAAVAALRRTSAMIRRIPSTSRTSYVVAIG
jgi:DNA-binding winged helix-turn-helix (wHTH) protein